MFHINYINGIYRFQKEFETYKKAKKYAKKIKKEYGLKEICIVAGKLNQKGDNTNVKMDCHN